jgi:hypothetical protein
MEIRIRRGTTEPKSAISSFCCRAGAIHGIPGIRAIVKKEMEKAASGKTE